MNVTHLPFSKTGYFSKMMIDYLNQEKLIQPFYNHFPNHKGFEKQLQQKSSFSLSSRKTLVEVLQEQYTKLEASILTGNHIKSILQENTFTITTGHQLNLFTGPLYFLYKIISTINLCEELSIKFPNKKFVPVYWMATEDHDFDEISFFNFKGTKVVWNAESKGAVGRLSTKGLESVFYEFSKHLGNSKNAEYLKHLFKKAYLEHQNLSDATRYLANELFGAYGLVILDADDTRLKRLFIPYLKKEIEHQVSHTEVVKTIKKFEDTYKPQVNPREINLFYLTDALRERIVFKDNQYHVKNTSISWTLKELLELIEKAPERFSPNVILRPLYQEVILPNLCYIGGGGELAYWLELQSFFASVKVPYPILLLRNSALIISKKQYKKLEKLSISIDDIFKKQQDLVKLKVLENSKISFNFNRAKKLLQQQFLALQKVAEQTDASFVGAVNAQLKKQTNGLQNLEKRMLLAEKRNQANMVERIIAIQNELFPHQSLEERQRNFSEFYLDYGSKFVKTLKENLNPLQLAFTVVSF